MNVFFLESSLQESGRAEEEVSAFQKSVVLSSSRSLRRRRCDELSSVCSDVIDACQSVAARKGWTWADASASNGKIQHILELSSADPTFPARWTAAIGHMDALRNKWLPLARHVRLGHEDDSSVFGKNQQQQKIGSSVLIPEKEGPVLVHAWSSRRQARAFASHWTRLWQAIFDYRIPGLFAPFSVMYCIRGEYCSVTALPPILVSCATSKEQADDLSLSTSGRRNSSSFTSSSSRASMNSSSGLASYSLGRLNKALMLSSADMDVPLGVGADGRCYVMSIEYMAVREHELPGFDGVFARSELFEWLLFHPYCKSVGGKKRHQRRRSEADETAVTSSVDSVASAVPVPPPSKGSKRESASLPIPVFVKQSMLPELVRYLVSYAAAGHAAATRVVDLIAERVVPNAFHRFGVPLSLLFYVYHRAVDSASTMSLDMDPTCLELLRDLIATEMAGRALKHIVLDDFNDFRIERSEGSYIETLQVVLGHLREPAFWRDVMMPQMRQKFRLSSDCEMDQSFVSVEGAVTIVAMKLGLSYDSAAGVFASDFDACGASRLVCFSPNAHLALAVLQADDDGIGNGGDEGGERLIRACEFLTSSAVGSIERSLLLVRVASTAASLEANSPRADHLLLAVVEDMKRCIQSIGGNGNLSPFEGLVLSACVADLGRDAASTAMAVMRLVPEMPSPERSATDSSTSSSQHSIVAQILLRHLRHQPLAQDPSSWCHMLRRVVDLLTSISPRVDLLSCTMLVEAIDDAGPDSIALKEVPPAVLCSFPQFRARLAARHAAMDAREGERRAIHSEEIVGRGDVAEQEHDDREALIADADRNRAATEVQIEHCRKQVAVTLAIHEPEQVNVNCRADDDRNQKDRRPADDEVAIAVRTHHHQQAKLVLSEERAIRSKLALAAVRGLLLNAGLWLHRLAAYLRSEAERTGRSQSSPSPSPSKGSSGVLKAMRQSQLRLAVLGQISVWPELDDDGNVLVVESCPPVDSLKDDAQHESQTIQFNETCSRWIAVSVLLVDEEAARNEIECSAISRMSTIAGFCLQRFVRHVYALHHGGDPLSVYSSEQGQDSHVTTKGRRQKHSSYLLEALRESEERLILLQREELAVMWCCTTETETVS